jgi:exodeoxyribonuclease VII small subunit
MAAKKAPPERTFAESRRRLDEILEELEREAGDVDQLAARIREASELIRFCRERLSAARQEVREVVAGLEAPPPEAESLPADDDDGNDEPAPEAQSGTLPF